MSLGRLRRNAFGRRDIEKRYSSRHNQIVRSGRRQRGYPMIKYIIKAEFTLVDGTILRTEKFVATGEYEEEALNDASKRCDKIATEMTLELKDLVTYVYTGEVAKDDRQIIGGNGITEGPMSEFEANERIIELIEEFPDTKFEIKEVK